MFVSFVLFVIIRDPSSPRPITRLLLGAIAWLFALAACTPIAGKSVSPITPTSPPDEPPSAPIRPRLAWFYKPPAEEQFDLVTTWYDFFILTKGDEAVRDRLLASGEEGPILEYFRFDAIYDPQSCTAQPWDNQVAYYPGDFCTISREHPDWFLTDAQGRRFYRAGESEGYVMMDPGNPGWRAFFLERLRENMADANWGGVFLDNVEVTMAFREDRGEMPTQYPDEASYQEAVQGFLAYLREGYFAHSSQVMFANLVARKDEVDWPAYLTYIDGAMHEGWAIDWPNGLRPVEVWEKQMSLAEYTQSIGKTIILVSHGRREQEDLQRFAYASYLLVNQGRAFFRYAYAYNQVWLYENYALDLGEPLGPRERDGDFWQRAYTRGIVRVNPWTGEAVIQEISPNGRAP
ncbi:MAG: hypothetical protein D6770_08355 [Anaerolineae bacterium]|nr:MAG: hypothetical protein D6770_08355 [Anaerolineae bacterium]